MDSLDQRSSTSFFLGEKKQMLGFVFSRSKWMNIGEKWEVMMKMGDDVN